MVILPCNGMSLHRSTAQIHGPLSLACSGHTPNPASGRASLADAQPVEVHFPSAHGGMAAHIEVPRISTHDLGVLNHGRDQDPGNHCNSCQHDFICKDWVTLTSRENENRCIFRLYSLNSRVHYLQITFGRVNDAQGSWNCASGANSFTRTNFNRFFLILCQKYS